MISGKRSRKKNDEDDSVRAVIINQDIISFIEEKVKDKNLYKKYIIYICLDAQTQKDENLEIIVNQYNSFIVAYCTGLIAPQTTKITLTQIGWSMSYLISVGNTLYPKWIKEIKPIILMGFEKIKEQVKHYNLDKHFEKFINSPTANEAESILPESMTLIASITSLPGTNMLVEWNENNIRNKVKEFYKEFFEEISENNEKVSKINHQYLNYNNGKKNYYRKCKKEMNKYLESVHNQEKLFKEALNNELNQPESYEKCEKINELLDLLEELEISKERFFEPQPDLFESENCLETAAKIKKTNNESLNNYLHGVDNKKEGYKKELENELKKPDYSGKDEKINELNDHQIALALQEEAYYAEPELSETFMPKPN